MKYALLIYDTPSAWDGLSDQETNAIMGEYFAVTRAPGVVGGEQLHPVETATTVRVKDGDALTTDGPFADTKEFLGGFYLLEADDLDAAIEIASRIPAARMGGSVEIRPVVER
ncbi:MAG: YciI family protein [Actinomycetota bacterium]|nr:YciI family protein [Actinomycetota bacterium]